MEGTEEFRIVSPVYKQEIYSGVLEELPPTETPIDFFQRVDYIKYPLFEFAKVLSVKVSKG